MARELAVALAVIIAGCASRAPSPPPAPAVTRAAPPSPPTPTVPTLAASRPALSILDRRRPPASAPAADLGVPECDKYLQKIESCMLARLPVAQQTQLRQALVSTRAAWKRLQAHDRTALELACLQAQDTARKMLAQFNCGW